VTDSAREEAERLVAAALGMASMAARGLRGSGPIATGSRECCVCPVCRTIAAMREPNPEFAERVATGAGDLAAAVASLLRSLSDGVPTARSPRGRAERDRDEWDPGERDPESDDAWRVATRGGPAAGGGPAVPGPADAPGGDLDEPPRPAPKPMAKKAVRKVAPKKVDPDPGTGTDTAH
jgi:hypothetical protein